jgi:rSAM/selenodomain-associated transferase 1
MNFRFPEGRILIFAKAPVPGEVKTRLQPRLSMQQCARLQQRLIEHTLRTCLDSNLCAVELWCSGDARHVFFEACRQRYPVAMHVQQGRDLGARMLHALDRALQRAKFALIVGTDCPALTATHLEAAADILHANAPRQHAVFIPADDGGYVLLGATCASPALTENIEWSSDRVMAQSRRNLGRANIAFTELDRLWDVDRPQDLERLNALAFARDWIEKVAQ